MLYFDLINTYTFILKVRLRCKILLACFSSLQSTYTFSNLINEELSDS